jgi:phosphoadenosine phosphosulfate reductase
MTWNMMDAEKHGLDDGQVRDLNARFEPAHPSAIVKWAADRFGGRLVMTSSFGADAMCTIHLATQVMPDIRIVLVNTGYLFPETLTFMEEMRERYKLNVLEFHTQNDPVVWLSINGEPDPRVRNNVPACCGANKNPVMDRALQTLAPAAFLRGVRAGQTAKRADMKIIEWMDRYRAWAISPILRWSSRDVFDYMKQHNLPHHPLWEKGYTSIGCSPLTCTRAVGADEDERAGRWAGSDKKECGINLDLGKEI